MNTLGLENDSSNIKNLTDDISNLNIVSLSYNKNILFYVKNNGECYVTDGKGKPSDINFKLRLNNFPKLDNFSFKKTLKLTGTLNKKYLIKVACGRGHVVFLTHAGMVFTLGEGTKGQLGHLNTSDSTEPFMITSLLNYRINDISVGCDHNIVIGSLRELTRKSNPSINSDLNNNKDKIFIFSWGDNTKGQLGLGNDNHFVTTPQILENLSNKNFQVKKVQTGLEHTLILLEDGKLYGMGSNEYKQISGKNINKSEMNFNNNLIFKPFRINEKIYSDNNEKIKFTNIKCSAYSSLLISDIHILLYGKINNCQSSEENLNLNSIRNKIYKIKDESLAEKLSSSDINLIFDDEYLRIFIEKEEGNKLNFVEEFTDEHGKLSSSLKEVENNEHKKVKKIHENFKLTLTENSNQNNFPTNIDESGLFQEYDLSREIFIDNASTNELFDSSKSFEQSIEELRNYISLVGISYVGDLSNNPMSFRPKNLPKKSAEEEEYHRKLVEENRRRYLQYLSKKHNEERRQREKLDMKKLKLRKLQETWENEILPNWFKKKNEYNYLKKYFYEGIPACLRARIWLRCIGNNFSINREYYEIEVKKAVQILLQLQINEKIEGNTSSKTNSGTQQPTEIPNKYNIKIIDKEKSIKYIELDIERTFPLLGIFKGNSPLSEDLREVLRAFVASRPDIGYVQGLSYIAGILLIYMDKYQAFVALMNITLSHNIIPYYRFDEHQIRKRLQIFKQIFYHNLPELCDHFESLDILPEHYLIEWNMTLFGKSLNIDVSARVWDIYMIEGVKAIYQASIGKLV